MELDKLKEIFMNPILILNFPKNEKTSFDSKIGTITFSNKTYSSRIIIENDEKQWIFSYKKENSIICRTRITIKYKTSNRKLRSINICILTKLVVFNIVHDHLSNETI